MKLLFISNTKKRCWVRSNLNLKICFGDSQDYESHNSLRSYFVFVIAGSLGIYSWTPRVGSYLIHGRWCATFSPSLLVVEFCNGIRILRLKCWCATKINSGSGISPAIYYLLVEFLIFKPIHWEKTTQGGRLPSRCAIIVDKISPTPKS